MLTRDAIRYFGTAAAVAKALGISPQAVSQWGKTVPDSSKFKLHVITNGKLAAEPPRRAAEVNAR